MIQRNLTVLFFVFLLFSLKSFAQNRSQFPVVVSVFNVASELPGTGYLGVFTTPVHPGVSVGSEYTYNSSPSHQLFQTAHLSYLFHQYAQHGIQLYSEFGYRYWLKNGLHFGPKLGIGYLHSIPDAQVFKLNEDGTYDRKFNFGRAQFMADFVIQLGYEFRRDNPIDVFLNYQFFMQMPFVNEYVPILPNSALHVGVAFYPFQTQNGE